MTSFVAVKMASCFLAINCHFLSPSVGLYVSQTGLELDHLEVEIRFRTLQQLCKCLSCVFFLLFWRVSGSR